MSRKLPLLFLLGAACAWAQSAISAKSGMIHHVEGKVLLDGQPVDPKFAEFPQVLNDQVLATEEGRAEVLLTPGVFLRLSEGSSFQMESNKLSDTALKVLSGSALFEVDELLPDNAITVHFNDASMVLLKKGLYRIDADQNRLRVYDGEVRITSGAQTITAKKGKQVQIGAVLQASNFDTKTTDPFFRWASRRSEYIATANVSSARLAGSSGLVSSYGSWAWNPWFGMFTYLPGTGYYYNPFGYMFYSPGFVYYAYQPYYYGGGYGGYGYGGGGGRPGASPSQYSVTNTGAVALAPQRASSAAVAGPSIGGGGAVSGGGGFSGTAGVASSGGGGVSRGASAGASGGSRGR